MLLTSICPVCIEKLTEKRMNIMPGKDLPQPNNPYGYTIKEVTAIIGEENVAKFHLFMANQTVCLDPKTNESLFYSIDVYKFIKRLPVTD